jgi:hypothetical protein
MYRIRHNDSTRYQYLYSQSFSLAHGKLALQMLRILRHDWFPADHLVAAMIQPGKIMQFMKYSFM